MSIAVVTGGLSHRAGGLFNSVRQSALALAEAGRRITVIGVSDPATLADLPDWAPLLPVIAPPLGPTSVGFAPGVGRALRAGRFDVAHQHGIWQAFSYDVMAWRRRTGGKVIISPRGMLDPWAIRNSRWKKRISMALYEWRNLDGAACLHALNNSELASMRGLGLENPVAVIPNGVKLPNLRFRPPRPEFLGRDDRKILLFLGRIHSKKGVEPLRVCRRLQPLRGWSDGKEDLDAVFT